MGVVRKGNSRGQGREGWTTGVGGMAGRGTLEGSNTPKVCVWWGEPMRQLSAPPPPPQAAQNPGLIS